MPFIFYNTLYYWHLNSYWYIFITCIYTFGGFGFALVNGTTYTTHQHQERTPDWLGHSYLHKSTPRISVLRSMPGRVKANVTWLQGDFNSEGPGMCRTSSPPVPIPWRVVDGGMKSTAMIHFRASTRYITKQTKPTGRDGLGLTPLRLKNYSSFTKSEHESSINPY